MPDHAAREQPAAESPASPADHDRPGMGPDRLRRVRWAARAHRAAAQAVRDGPAVAAAGRLRGRAGRLQPAARARLDPAGHLLRLAAARSGRGDPRRGLLHRARPGHHPRARGPLPGAPPAGVDRGRGGRIRRGRARGGRGRRGGPDPGELAAGRREYPGDPRRARPLDRLPGGRRGGRRDRRAVAGHRPGGLRAGRGRGADLAGGPPARPGSPGRVAGPGSGSSGPAPSGPGLPGWARSCCRWPPRCLPRAACSRWPGRASRSVLSPTAGVS